MVSSVGAFEEHSEHRAMNAGACNEKLTPFETMEIPVTSCEELLMGKKRMLKLSTPLKSWSNQKSLQRLMLMIDLQ